MKPGTTSTRMMGIFAVLLFLFETGLAQQVFPPTMFNTKIIEVDGVRVPDIGPLPTMVPIPATNLNYKAKVKLGKQLYFDGRLSSNNAISCAFCHLPSAGFADPKQVSIGVGGKQGERNSPTVFNTAFNPVQFWDGRVSSLEEQALGPIHNPVEMAETHDNVVIKLRKIQGYQDLFQKVFGTGVNLQNIVEAIAAYERTIISTNSPFDKYVLGDSTAMSEDAVKGMALFKGKARCILCHNGPNFTNNRFYNLGVPQVGPQKKDLGRYNVTHLEKDKRAFKTPTLRSITETTPYMHDGAFKTLEEVIDFLDNGGGDDANKHSLMKPLALTKAEKGELLAFLHALKGEEIPFEFPSLPE
ncbi:cytochrome-c peroxidase [Nitrospira sp. T9]|uniref:cytochrome-c peroxidase n=1 Tax=unclassified Nitrospira TaxID=2652172 RepID=UPI003F9BDA3C